MEMIYRMLLTFNSTSFILVIYLIQNKYYFLSLENRPLWISHITFLVFPIVLTGISLLLKRYLSSDSIECEITEVELANHGFLPSYLGYFFVALSVKDVEVMVFVYAVLFLFTYLSQVIYFNPLFLCFRYHFYYVVTENNVKQLIISRKRIRTTENLSFPRLRRINFFTYIDTEETEDESCDSKNPSEREGNREV